MFSRFLLVDFGLAQKIDRIMPTNGVDQKTISVENSSIDSLSENRNGFANLEPSNSQTVNGRKRKFNDLNEGQVRNAFFLFFYNPIIPSPHIAVHCKVGIMYFQLNVSVYRVLGVNYENDNSINISRAG